MLLVPCVRHVEVRRPVLIAMHFISLSKLQSTLCLCFHLPESRLSIKRTSLAKKHLLRGTRKVINVHTTHFCARLYCGANAHLISLLFCFELRSGGFLLLLGLKRWNRGDSGPKDIKAKRQRHAERNLASCAPLLFCSKRDPDPGLSKNLCAAERRAADHCEDLVL